MFSDCPISTTHLIMGGIAFALMIGGIVGWATTWARANMHVEWGDQRVVVTWGDRNGG